jgi:hypothetical protein
LGTSDFQPTFYPESDNRKLIILLPLVGQVGSNRGLGVYEHIDGTWLR